MNAEYMVRGGGENQTELKAKRSETKETSKVKVGGRFAVSAAINQLNVKTDASYSPPHSAATKG